MAIPFADEFKDGQWNSTFFDDVGDETGNFNMNVDGSVTPQEFKITPPDDKTYYVHRMIGIIKDAGSFDSGGFGNGAALTNGCELWFYDAPMDTYRLMTNQHTIKQNVDFAAYCYDLTVHPWGSGDQALVWRFTMTRDGAPFKLRRNDSLVWRINDNLTGLSAMHIRAGMVSVPTLYSGQ